MENLQSFIERLYKGRISEPCPMPATADSQRFIEDLTRLLFPLELPDSFEGYLGRFSESESLLKKLLQSLKCVMMEEPEGIAEEFFNALPAIYDKLLLDAEAIYQFDPAAKSLAEVVHAYPGFFAICVYRIANQLLRQQVPYLPRVIAEFAHSKTGIDINPGATIGDSFFIDHGTGIVIGETTHIGNHVKLYQGVTLGAMQVEKSLASTKRHPTIEDHVVIYAGSTVLGGETVIGHHSVIGGNVWLTESVPPYSLVVRDSQIKIRKRKN
jgi:serine O-acetyltransferase